MLSRRRSQRGMTLVELIAAFTILALLTSMSVPLTRYKVRRDKERELRSALREIRRAIDSLPEKQRAAVLMHKYDEMEYSQIASVLECSESAVKSLLFRAYESLRARLAHMA